MGADVMEADPLPQPSTGRPYLLLGVNLLLGLVLWLGITSDLEWTSDVVNYLFPPAVALLALISWRRLRRSRPNSSGKRAQLWQDLCFAPSFAGGVPYLILMLVALVPPILFATLLGGMFSLSEHLNAVVIQEAQSPDGNKTAVVTFYPVGAYSGGSGRITVELHYRYVPFVQRSVYYLPASYEAYGDPQEYVTWLDGDTLQLLEENEPLAVGRVDWHLPWFIAVPVELGPHLPRIVTELIRAYGPFSDQYDLAPN
jgi:hypothetical protein